MVHSTKKKSSSLARVSLSALGLALVIACSSSDDTPAQASVSVSYKAPAAGRTVNPPVVKDIGAEGGELELQDGARLEIPAGALASKTAISAQLISSSNANGDIRYYKLEPDGLQFTKPATLRIGFKKEDLEGGRVVVRNFSNLNPEKSDGHKKGKFALGELTEGQQSPGQLSFKVPHFSFWQANSGADRAMHLVTDIPARNMEPGDTLFMLTAIGGGPDWGPGHVAVFTGGRKNACAPEFSDELIEATGDAVRVHSLETEILKEVDPETGQTVDNPRKGVKDEDNHFYLGAFRPEGGLLGSTRDLMVSFVRKQVGKPYSLVGGRWTDYESFSCVGLAETALDVVDKGVLNDFREFSISTPVEMFQNMKPVREAKLFAGDVFEMPILGTIVHPDSTGFYTSDGKFCPGPLPCCSAVDKGICNDFTIVESGRPAGSSFEQTAPGKYVFKWTPGEGDAAPGGDGKTHEFKLTMKSPRVSTAGKLYGRNDLGPQEITETFKLVVFPCTFPGFKCAAATTPEDKTACFVGGEDARTALVTRTETLAAGGTHGNSNPAIPVNQVEGAVDLLGFAVALTGIDAQEIVDWNSVLGCFNQLSGLTGITLCAPQPIAPQPAEFLIAQVKLKDPVPMAAPSTHFQYAFV